MGALTAPGDEFAEELAEELWLLLALVLAEDVGSGCTELALFAC